MPSASSVPMPIADLMLPCFGVPASVTPRCKGTSVFSASNRYAAIISDTFWCFTDTLMSPKPCSSRREIS
jgi:hypothetical protein